MFVGVKYSIVIHLGTNPVRGGIPLNDKRSSGISACSSGEVLIDLLICEIYDIFLKWNIKNNGMIIMEYIKKYNIVIKGFTSIKPHIHPICVIDEYAIIDRNFD